MRFFRSLLSTKPKILYPDIPKSLPQHPVASALGMGPTEKEIATAIKAMANARAVGPDGVPAEMLKFGHRTSLDTEPSCWSSIGLTPSSGARGKSHRSEKTRSLPFFTKSATRRSAKSTAACRSCHTQIRFSLMCLSGDSALTERRTDCYRRSSAVFDRIAPPWT